jgi:hypothetical protein
MPVLVTGGIRRLAVAGDVVRSGVDMVGIATALAIEPDLPNQWKAGRDSAPALRPIAWKNKVMASMANMAAVKFQLGRLSRGKASKPGVSPLLALIGQQFSAKRQTRKYRAWLSAVN